MEFLFHSFYCNFSRADKDHPYVIPCGWSGGGGGGGLVYSTSKGTEIIGHQIQIRVLFAPVDFRSNSLQISGVPSHCCWSSLFGLPI